MENVCYNCTALAGTNKAGILKPDADGYYDVVLGAFDFPNSTGAVYPFNSAKKLFEKSSAFMRRIAKGQQYIELGHPKKVPGMTKAEYIQRILTIEETRVCGHLKEVRIERNKMKDRRGRPIVAVMGKVKPSGPYADTLRESLENPAENVAFSVRSLTRDIRLAGILQKHMTTLITYDKVIEPGIAIATKYDNPALESMDTEVQFRESDFDAAGQLIEESGVSMESGLDIITVMDEQGFSRKTQNLNRVFDW